MSKRSADGETTLGQGYPPNLNIASNGVAGHVALYKFGHDGNTTTSWKPVCTQGDVQLPPPSGAQPLRAVSSAASDNAGGVGGIDVLIIGLDASGDVIQEVITLTGTTPTAYTAQSFWRVNFCDLITSGRYAGAVDGSHDGDISITDASANVWALIEVNGIPQGRWQSAFYTVPNGKTVYVSSVDVASESNKTCDFKIIARTSADDEASPYSAVMELIEFTGVAQDEEFSFAYEVGPFTALTDLGFLSRVSSGTAQTSAGMNMVIVDG